MEKMESHMAPSRLFSEQMDPQTFYYLGNFPQTFSRIGYIMSAYYIEKYGINILAGEML